MHTKIHRSKDCGNSPKQKLLQDFAIAIARTDFKTIQHLTTEDVVWHQSGRAVRKGQNSVLTAVKALGPVEAIEVSDVISHGRKGAVRGKFAIAGKSRSFSHFIEFANTKCTHIKHIHTMSVAAT